MGQLNANGQAVFASSDAEAHDVTVNRDGNTTADSDGDLVGDGIDASSTSHADTDVTLDVDQTNESSLDGDGATVLQGQLVGQLNLNGQFAGAVADADSGDVTVNNNLNTKAGWLSAGGDGIKAESKAVAKSELNQDVEQKNKNTNDVDTSGVLTPFPRPYNCRGRDDLLALHVPDGLAVQLDLVGQANVNLQVGVAYSEAQSGDVKVNQSGSLTAGGDGIDADSKAVAIAELDQKAKQNNSNEMTAGGPEDTSGDDENESPGNPTIALQGQLTGQLNLNIQAGAAIADAESGDVNVYQDGPISATGDSINAESKAVAVADLDQKARQKNDNEAEATLRNPAEFPVSFKRRQHRCRSDWPAGAAGWADQCQRATRPGVCRCRLRRCLRGKHDARRPGGGQRHRRHLQGRGRGGARAEGQAGERERGQHRTAGTARTQS